MFVCDNTVKHPKDTQSHAVVVEYMFAVEKLPLLVDSCRVPLSNFKSLLTFERIWLE